jgi:hypothetical protein
MSQHHPTGSAESKVPAGVGSTGASRERWTAVNRPFFWIASSAVFLVNAILSFVQGQWGLAGLETATGILALVAAASVAESRRRLPSGERTSTADITSPHDPEQA